MVSMLLLSIADFQKRLDQVPIHGMETNLLSTCVFYLYLSSITLDCVFTSSWSLVEVLVAILHPPRLDCAAACGKCASLDCFALCLGV